MYYANYICVLVFCVLFLVLDIIDMVQKEPIMDQTTQIGVFIFSLIFIIVSIILIYCNCKKYERI